MTELLLGERISMITSRCLKIILKQTD